jgi:hypothetical protein
MKRKITLLLLAAGSVLTMKSQVIINEGFTATFNPIASGWATSNLSSPIGTTSWFQGNPNSFPAFSGPTNSYYGANFNNAAAAGGGISNWLMTPVVSIYNGAVLEFATRTADQGVGQPNFRPDRLQLRMSPANSTVIPTGTTSIGTYTTLLLDINPNLNTSTVSAVSNGSVNGYPPEWVVYTIQITGVTGTLTGRFGFRYFVDGGGNPGPNSNYIGIDAVKYTLPCAPSLTNYTVCAGASAIIVPTNTVPATTYLWSNGATTSTAMLTPTVSVLGATEIFTLFPSNGNISCGNPQTLTITIGSQLNVNVNASALTICSGRAATLTANSAAGTYTWANGLTPIGNTAVITVTPNSTTTYSVGSLSGFCYGGNSITINVIPSPTLIYAINPSTICLGNVGMTVSTTGATTYTYFVGSSILNSNPLTSISVPTVSGIYEFDVFGTGANGCISGGTATFAVNPNPTITIVSSSNVVCINKTVTLTATGAVSYSWSGASSASTSPTTFSTGTVAGNRSFTCTGTSSVGCVGTAVRNVSVSICTGIVNNFGNVVETSVFPNPFVNELKVEGLLGSIQIINALGQVIYTSQVNDMETINTSELTKGVYILKAYDTEGHEVKTVKMLKN